MNEYQLFYEKISIYHGDSEWHKTKIPAESEEEARTRVAEQLFNIDSKSASSYVGDAYLIAPDGRKLVIHDDKQDDSIDTIIFDIGGVLAKGAHRGIIWEWLEQNKTVSPELIKEFRFGKFREQEYAAWKDYKIGKCSHDNYWQRTLETTGLENRGSEIAKLVWDGFSKCQPERGMKFVPALKEQGYRLAVLSNHVKEWGWSVVDQLKLQEYCNPIIISADIGMKKPDEEIYAYTLKAVGRESEPHKCLFIDDKIENVLAARNAGMCAVQFKDKDDFSADQLLALELRSYGIVLPKMF